jgi:predicted hydrocarbon binding protein
MRITSRRSRVSFSAGIVARDNQGKTFIIVLGRFTPVRMKFVKISSDELAKARQLYESIMSYACHGLFFREGILYGAEIAKIADSNSDDYLNAAAKIMVARGWVESVDFREREAIVKGSVEVKSNSESETCHRVRGIVSRVYEGHLGGPVRCTETSCESTGKTSCVFIVEPETTE